MSLNDNHAYCLLNTMMSNVTLFIIEYRPALYYYAVRVCKFDDNVVVFAETKY